MANGLNQVTLFGNLGADPELKVTQGGNAILKLRLATAESFKDKGGEWQEKTEWHSVVVFGGRAEGLAKILAKGSSILVIGSLHTSSYEKDGTKMYRTEVVAKDVILGGRGSGAGRDSGGARAVPGVADRGQRGGDVDYDSLPATPDEYLQGAKARSQQAAKQRPAAPDDMPVDDDGLPF